MSPTNAELLNVVSRYAVDNGLKLGKLNLVRWWAFAEWLLEQKLQQPSVMCLRDLLAQKLKEAEKAVPVAHSDPDYKVKAERARVLQEVIWMISKLPARST